MASPMLELLAETRPTSQPPVRLVPRSRDADIDAIVAEVRGYGDRWLADDMDFVEVTLATAQAKRRVAALERRAAGGTPFGRVLLAPAPGDQHDFGIQLLAMQLREAGWQVTDDLPTDAGALTEAVRTSPFAAVGLSVGHERAVEPVARLVRELRGATCDPEMRIALGGAVLNGRPALARAMGADIHADDAQGLLAELFAGLLETR